MNYTQSFEEFSRSVSSTDLALYAGVGIVLWVLFRDKLSPVQKLVTDMLGKLKNNVPSVATTLKPTSTKVVNNEVFFDLVSSWKQTRDLAVRGGCEEAVKVADQMFPYLSPSSCDKGNANE